MIDVGLDPSGDETVMVSIQVGTAARACEDDTPLACFFEQLAYVNVHTQAFLMGEIRGNLLLLPEPSPGLLSLVALVAISAVAPVKPRETGPQQRRSG